MYVGGNPDCIFCQLIDQRDLAVRFWSPDNVLITPLNPVTEGHVMMVPRYHVRDFRQSPEITKGVMRQASAYARDHIEGDVNLITSAGPDATQTVFHMHVHLVPRREGDGLHLPWTGQVKE